jgi:hypothetical protein
MSPQINNSPKSLHPIQESLQKFITRKKMSVKSATSSWKLKFRMVKLNKSSKLKQLITKFMAKKNNQPPARKLSVMVKEQAQVQFWSLLMSED